MKQFQNKGFKYFEQFSIMIPNAIPRGKSAYVPGKSSTLTPLNTIDLSGDDETSFHATSSSQIPPSILTCTNDSLIFQEVPSGEREVDGSLSAPLPVDAMDTDDPCHTSATSTLTNNLNPPSNPSTTAVSSLMGASAKQKAHSPPPTIYLPVGPDGTQTHTPTPTPPSLESPIPSKLAKTTSDSASHSKAMKNRLQESACAKHASSAASSSRSRKSKTLNADVQFHQLSLQVATLNNSMQSINKDPIAEVRVKATEMVRRDSTLLTPAEQVNIMLLFTKNSSYTEVLLGLTDADDKFKKRFYDGLLHESL